MLGLFLPGFFVARARSVRAAIAACVGVLVIFWMTFSPKLEGDLAVYRSPFHSLLITVFGTLAIFAVGVLLSRLLPQKQDESGRGRNWWPMLPEFNSGLGGIST